MTLILFYGKPGCATNARQKQWFQRAGCMVIERDLLQHGMEPKELLSYLEPLPVREWFNPNAPEVKNGQINPAAYDEESALAQLMENPLLIRRPLISIQGKRLCGFDQSRVEGVLKRLPGERISNACSGSPEQCEPSKESR